VPAVVEIARRAGLVLTGRLPYEACTPTGIALLATLATRQGTLPALRPESVGLGAGGRDPAEAPNVLRLLIGSPPVGSLPEVDARPGAGGVVEEPAILIECNVDDLDPRLWPAALAELFAAGASDAWLTPILMKKGRPAHTLSVLCPQETITGVQAAMFAHTTTIGVRHTPVTKYPLARELASVEIGGETIAVKLALRDGHVVNASVEYEDVIHAARALKRAPRQVLAEASALAQARWPVAQIPPAV
jgi:uncharacterized protein (DUF111 family)